MKKEIYLLFVVIWSCVLVACSSSDDNYITPAEQVELWGKQVIECFVNEDKETLKGLFNEKMKQKYNLDFRFQQCFDYLDGEIVSYGEIFGDTSGGEMRGEEGKVKEAVSCIIRDVETDKGTTYSIVISAYTIYKDDEEYLGLKSISIRNENLYAEDSENPNAEMSLSYD